MLTLWVFVCVLLPITTSFSFCDAIHANGFTWSATPSSVPSSVTKYGVLQSPQVALNNDYIYLTYVPSGTTSVAIQTFDWNYDRLWSSPSIIFGASTVGGAALTAFENNMVAVWSDATTSTLRFSSMGQSANSWGAPQTSTNSIYQSPPSLYVPPSPQMQVFYRTASSTATTYSSAQYDLYSIYPPTSIPNIVSRGHGTVVVNNADVYTYVFYQGLNSSGGGDGFVHYTKQNQQTEVWAADTRLAYAIDVDSTLSAVNWANSTGSYIFVFYKYLNTVMYFSYVSGAGFTPSTGSNGYSTQLATLSGPSAVVYQDSFVDTQIISVFFSAYRWSSNDIRVFNAIAVADSWP